MIDVRPAEASRWDDVAAVFGRSGEAAHCWCQRFTMGRDWWSATDEVKRDRLRDDVADHGAGLLGYDGDLPVAWAAVARRPAYPSMPKPRTVLAARGERPDDDGVWVVSCLVVRAGHRRRGHSTTLARAAVAHAFARGARAVEAYPMITTPGQEITWGELHVGSRSAFAAAGLVEVAHPTKRRVIMRVEAPPRGSA